MNNGPSFFEIQADDIARAREFYSKSFGWEFTGAEGVAIEFWRIKTGTLPGGLLKRPSQIPAAPSGTNAFTCSIETNDFDATAKTILGNGGKVALPKFAVHG